VAEEADHDTKGRVHRMASKTMTTVDEEVEPVDIEFDEATDIVPEDDVPSTDINAEEEEEPEPLDLKAYDADDTALDSAIFAENALVLPDDIDMDQWLRLGANLMRIGAGHQWWAGDWMLAGERKFKEESSQGLDAFASIAPQTLANWRHVAAMFPPEAREPRLTWTHHRIAAELPQLRARKLALKKAVEDDPIWTTRAMEAYVKSKKEAKKDKATPVEVDDSETGAETKSKTSTTFSLNVTVKKAHAKFVAEMFEELEAQVKAELADNEIPDPRVTTTTA
jgi:hypothetical protein